jgi:hypothetical protein
MLSLDWAKVASGAASRHNIIILQNIFFTIGLLLLYGLGRTYLGLRVGCPKRKKVTSPGCRVFGQTPIELALAGRALLWALTHNCAAFASVAG